MWRGEPLQRILYETHTRASAASQANYLRHESKKHATSAPRFSTKASGVSSTNPATTPLTAQSVRRQTDAFPAATML